MIESIRVCLELVCNLECVRHKLMNYAKALCCDVRPIYLYFFILPYVVYFMCDFCVWNSIFNLSFFTI